MSNKTKSDSIEFLQKKADNNDAVAMYQLAEELLSKRNDDDAPNIDKALDYLKQASDSGYKPAAYRMYIIQAGREREDAWQFGGTRADRRSNERIIKSVDHENAIEYLSLVTNSDALKDDEITALDDENKIIIKGKLTWSDEYSSGEFLPINIEKSVVLAISIVQNIENHVNLHLENNNHLNIEQVSKKQDDTNDFLSIVMQKLLGTLLYGYRKDKHLVSSEIIDRCMMMSAKLILQNDIKSEFYEEEQLHMQNEAWRFNSFYEYSTRFNPDGNKQYVPMNANFHENEKKNSSMSYNIDLEYADPYNAYITFLSKNIRTGFGQGDSENKFGPRQIENAVLRADSVSSLLDSIAINRLKDEYLNRYIPSLEFAYQYCLLLMLANQNVEALNIYTNVIGTHKKYRKTFSKITFDLMEKFKKLVINKKTMTFDDYKHNIYTEVLAKDPCYLYKQEKSNGNFNQKYYEMCKFPKLKVCKDLFSRFQGRVSYDDMSIFDIKYYPQFIIISKETLEYLKTLYSGGHFKGIDIEKDISRSMKLSKRSAKYIVKYCRSRYFPKEKKDKLIYIKFLRNHINIQRLNGKLVSDRYYNTLTSLGRSTDYQSDYQVLSDILYKQKGYSEYFKEIMQSLKDMTSGMDYYYGTEDDYQIRHFSGYDSEKWSVYPVKYDARKKFNAFFLENIKHLDQSAREENNPFHAFLCVSLLKIADQWKNNNRDIMRWLASDHFHALEVENGDGVPFQDIEDEKDENIQSILYSLKNNEKNIDYSKAIDIDGYAAYSDKVDAYISIATDGFVKIPEILFIRALLYLNNFVEHSKIHNSRLSRLTKKFYERDLQMIEVLSQNLVIHDDEKYDVENESGFVTHPFLNSLAKSSTYVDSDSNSGIGSKNITKSLHYIDDILRKNDKDEMLYACHPSLIQDAIALKIELEKELHGQQVEKINEKEMELEVQKAKQKAAMEKEREMLSFLTHTLRNSLANGPAQLKQSIRLLGTDDYDESNSKYKAINNIVSQLSTFSVVNTLITTFKQYVGDQESFLAQWYEDKEGKADINWVVSFCLRQCISRALFFPNYQRVIKRLIKDDNSGYIKKTRKKYIENILSLNDDDSPTEKISRWMKNYLPKLEVNIDENSPEFAVNNIKYTYLFSIFSEVIWNAFKHTDGEHPISIRWVKNNGHYLFTVENHYIEDEINLESSTNKGLVFIERLLSMFDDASLTYSKDESNKFVASIKLPDIIFSSI